MNNPLHAFPGASYLPDHRLLLWHPQGTLDDELADRLVRFVEMQERITEEPFNRYTDLSGLTEVRMNISHVFRIAEQRRTGYDGEEPVRSAFFCDKLVGFGMARLFETLMEGGPIEVRAFRAQEEVALWLGVPLDVLQAPARD